MSELTINGRAFRLQKLDPLTQLAIGIKALPLVPALRPAFAAAADMRARVAAAAEAAAEGREPEEPIAGAELSDADVMHLAAAVQKLGDDGRNYIIGACLRGVLMETEGGGFLPAWSTRTDTPDPSIDVVTMIRLVYAVVMDNISSFSSQMSAK